MKLPCILNGRPPTARLERLIQEALPGGQTAAASGAAAPAPTSVNHCVDVTDDSPTEHTRRAQAARLRALAFAFAFGFGFAFPFALALPFGLAFAFTAAFAYTQVKTEGTPGGWA